MAARTSQVAALADDERLVVRCLRNEAGSWNELFALCHSRMTARVESILARRTGGTESAQEITSEVWLSLVRNEGCLLRRFDAGKGARISTYLNRIAERAARQHLRAESRRRRRETTYSESRPLHVRSHGPDHAVLKEFVGRLSPRESRFWSEELLVADIHHEGSKSSRQAAWQLRSRILRKFMEFFGS
jgi:DNA-directed RNA polymerase specialized sigma24 family protein